MKIVFLGLVSFVLLLSSCKKQEQAVIKPVDGARKDLSGSAYSPNCLGKGGINYHWINDITHIKTYSGNTLVSTNTIHPNGFFRVNENQSYNVISNGVPLDGKWVVRSCNTITLDPGLSNERTFDIVSVDQTSLLITRRTGNTEYVQHYTKVPNPLTTTLQGTWQCQNLESSRIQGGTEVWKINDAVNLEFTLNTNGTFVYTDLNNPSNNLTGYSWNVGSQVLTFSYGFYPWCVDGTTSVPAYRQTVTRNRFTVSQINSNSIILSMVSLDDLLCRQSTDVSKFSGRTGAFHYKFYLTRK